MNKKLKILFSITLLALTSCDFDSEHINQNKKHISKIFLYDVSTDSTHFIRHGYNVYLLPKSKKLVYFHQEDHWLSSLGIYNYSTNNDVLLLNNLFVYTDENSISPDEKYLAYIKDNTLARIDLTNGKNEVLLKSAYNLNAPPRYSNDGKKIIYLCNPHNYFSDSVCVNIYDIESGNYTALDTIFIKGSYNINAYFTNDSQKFYILHRGYGGGGYYQLKFTIYNNSVPPTFFKEVIFYLIDYRVNVFNINDDKILILDHNYIHQYDISENKTTVKMSYGAFPQWFKKVKDLNKFIGINTNNSIEIINFDGIIENVFALQVDGSINWADYSEDDGYIFFNTIRTIYE